jgi:septal ring factor EnvC (AmiA/AmiB activator)
MGDKPFDGYARVLDGGGDHLKVAFAVDLGGAYLDSKQHGSQFSAMKQRAEKFASRTSILSIEEELAVEAKVLKTMEKEKVEMEKTIADSKKDIEEYQKRIAEAEQKIKDSEAGVAKKSEEITAQTTRIGDVEKKKKSVN